MSLFSRIFGKKSAPLSAFATDVNRMGDALLGASGVDFDRATQLEQALVGTFFFGMAYAHGMQNQLTPPQVHALVLRAYSEVFHYSPEAAAEAAQACIDASTPGHHDAMNAILHRGIDGHAQFTSGDASAFSENIRSVLSHYKN